MTDQPTDRSTYRASYVGAMAHLKSKVVLQFQKRPGRFLEKIRYMKIPKHLFILGFVLFYNQMYFQGQRVEDAFCFFFS